MTPIDPSGRRTRSSRPRYFARNGFSCLKSHRFFFCGYKPSNVNNVVEESGVSINRGAGGGAAARATRGARTNTQSAHTRQSRRTAERRIDRQGTGRPARAREAEETYFGRIGGRPFGAVPPGGGGGVGVPWGAGGVPGEGGVCPRETASIRSLACWTSCVFVGSPCISVFVLVSALVTSWFNAVPGAMAAGSVRTTSRYAA